MHLYTKLKFKIKKITYFAIKFIKKKFCYFNFNVMIFLLKISFYSKIYGMFQYMFKYKIKCLQKNSFFLSLKNNLLKLYVNFI